MLGLAHDLNHAAIAPARPSGLKMLTPPSLSGEALVGATLTLEPGVWTDAAGPLETQWSRDDAEIAGATGLTLTLGAADDGATVTARVTARDAKGRTLSVVVSAGVVTRRPATVVGTLADVTVVEGEAAAVVDAAAVFAQAEGGVWSVETPLDAPAGLAAIDQAGRVTLSTAAPLTATPVVVRFANSGGAAQAGFSVAVRPSGRFRADDWTLENAGWGGVLRATVLAWPPLAPGEVATGLDYSLDGGATALAAPLDGGFEISGLSDGVAAEVRLRLRTAEGPRAWSDPRAAIPTLAARLATFEGAAGDWGGVDLAEATTLSGAVAFSVVDGATPAGMSLHAPSGLVHGVPTRAGTSRAVYRCAAGGETEDVAVRFTVAAAPDADEHVTLRDGAMLARLRAEPSSGPALPELQSDRLATIYIEGFAATPSGNRYLFEYFGRTRVYLNSGRPVIYSAVAFNQAPFDNIQFNADYVLDNRSYRLCIQIDNRATQAIHCWAQRDGETSWTLLTAMSAPNAIYADMPIDWKRARFSVGSEDNGGNGLAAGDSLRYVAIRTGALHGPNEFGAAWADRVNPEIVMGSGAEARAIVVKGTLDDWRSGDCITGSSSVFTVANSSAVNRTGAAPRRAEATPFALPDAVGWGRTATGGRAGVLRDVTGVTPETPIPTPESRGAALKAALEAGGYVRLVAEGEYFLTEMVNPAADTTLDARFAPGLGAWLRGAGVRIEGVSNVVILGLLSAPGSTRLGPVWDNRRPLSISASAAMSNIYVRDCAALWSTDECVTVWGSGGYAASGLTLDRVLVAEALAFPREATPQYRQGHPLQVIFGGSANWSQVSVINLASVSGYSRNPLVNPFSPARFELEIIGSAFLNPGNQGGQLSTNGGDATTGARVEATLYVLGPMSPTNVEMIRIRGDLPDRLDDQTDLYLDPVTGVWTLSNGAITSTAFDPAPTGAGDLPWIVRDANVNGVLYGSETWGDPNRVGVPARSPSAPVYADLDSVYRDLEAHVGPKLRGGGRHPLVQRIINYALPPLNEAGTALIDAGTGAPRQPFLPDDGYRGRNLRGVIDELTHLGVVVTPGAGVIAVTVPADALPAHKDHPWTGITVQAARAKGPVVSGYTALDSYSSTAANSAYIAPSTHAARPIDQFATPKIGDVSPPSPRDDQLAPDWSSPSAKADIAPSGGATLSVAGGTYVVRVGWRTTTTTVWVESGLIWTVT